MNEKRIALGDRLDIEQVDELYQALLAALEARQHLVFEARELTRIDAAALQLVYAYVREATHMSLSWQWENPSQTLIHSARLLGLSQALHLEGLKH